MKGYKKRRNQADQAEEIKRLKDRISLLESRLLQSRRNKKPKKKPKKSDAGVLQEWGSGCSQCTDGCKKATLCQGIINGRHCPYPPLSYSIFTKHENDCTLNNKRTKSGLIRALALEFKQEDKQEDYRILCQTCSLQQELYFRRTFCSKTYLFNNL